MTFKTYHQVGHNSNWNIQSFVKDGLGDGLILSPLHQTRTQIEGLSAKIRKVSLFDPQYYLPNSQKDKLLGYSFFPERISGGFSRAKFATVALESARECLTFQTNHQFEALVIPTQFFSQMDPEFAEKQEAFSVLPFLRAAAALKVKKPLILSLALTSHMLESRKYRDDLLNWITSIQEISSVYVSVCNERETKQPISTEYLRSLLAFVAHMRAAGLGVIVGHLNTEALLLTLVPETAVTMGTFENTRTFSTDKFLAGDERRGPRARIYLPGLLNWLQVDQAKHIRRAAPGVWKAIYNPTSYSEAALAAVVEPTFNQPALYMHYFVEFSRQLDALKPLSPVQRYALLKEWIVSARNSYSLIAKAGVEIEKHGSNVHLAPWLSTIDAYAAEHF